jgi:hypothetical protein
MLGCLLVAWCPLAILDWPPFLCYRLYWKAPPWLLWKIPPLVLHCLNVYFEFHPETLDFLEFCFKSEGWILSKLHCTVVPWLQLNVQMHCRHFTYTPFGLPFFDILTIPTCHFQDHHSCIDIPESPQCHLIGSFPFPQRHCLIASAAE